MARKKEEIAADLVWQYVEHVRDAPESERLSDTELDQLTGVLKTAGVTGEALETERLEARQSAVRQRVEQLLAAAPESLTEPPRPRRPILPAVVPAWRFRVVCGAATLLAAGLATVGFWHHPPAQVQVQTVTQVQVRDLPDLDAMTEDTAHQLVPRMVHSRLSEREEKSLMGHLLVCEGCYRAYVQLKHEHDKVTSRPAPRLASW
jgi:hypothetical protein